MAKAKKKKTKQASARGKASAARKPKKKAARKAPARKRPVARKKPAKKAAKKAAKKVAKKVAKKKPAKAAPKRPAKKSAKAAPKRPAKKSPAESAPKSQNAAPAAAPPVKKARSRSRRSSRRASPTLRRGPDGELLAPGELLLPKGPRNQEEVHYLLRGCLAADLAAGAVGVEDTLTKAPGPDPEKQKSDLNRLAEHLRQRFESGSIEAYLPTRPPPPRTFAGVVERASQRRREIGAFLRGLDLGHMETVRMDSHGEASLHGLMEWAARLEKLMEAEEPQQSDYTQFHRGLDQLDHTTESLLVDVELTLRRQGSRRR